MSFYSGLCRVLGANISPTDSTVGSCFFLVSGDCQGVSGILREGTAFALNNAESASGTCPALSVSLKLLIWTPALAL